jgi:chromosome segregation ATPase
MSIKRTGRYSDDVPAMEAEIERLTTDNEYLKADAEHLTVANADLRAKIERLTAENERLRAALRDVINPLGSIRRDAESRGLKLSGMAYSIANDLGFVQKIAKDALDQQTTVNSDEGK